MKSCDTRKPRPEEKILSPEEIGMLKAEVRRRMTMKKYGRYYINGFAFLFSVETGVRIAELCAIKWEDIYDDHIHIHRQQLSEDDEAGNNTYYLADYTKNEKGISEDGRDSPLTDAIASLLSEIRTLQEELGMDPEFVFCHEDGEWIKKEAYATF
ncbi:MAG: tyrosine-type recombinase/integrase, partial [Lachnospiraceae bacterium]|nr:tyrosine-type recombinase/integrase [Lachnospiraceae bacterium]